MWTSIHEWCPWLNLLSSLPSGRGNLIIAGGTSMSIMGRGIVWFNLPNGSKAKLGRVVYVPGLAENLLLLEALHLAGFESIGSKGGYMLRKNGRVVAHRKRERWTTYLHSVKRTNVLLPVQTQRRDGNILDWPCLQMSRREWSRSSFTDSIFPLIRRTASTVACWTLLLHSAVSQSYNLNWFRKIQRLYGLCICR